MNTFETAIQSAATWLWGPPMLVILSLTGLTFTIRFRGLQFTRLGLALKSVWLQRSGSGRGSISPLQSLCGALGGLIGNGNLAGAATALFMGGPGALFWMWVGAFIGMIIVYTETLLALMYRERAADGTWSGGPMYYIQKVLKLRWLALAFAIAMAGKALLSTSTIQSNSISLAASAVIHLPLPSWVPVQLPFCILLSSLTLWVTLGGLKTIARTLERVTPLMVLAFLVLGLVIILQNLERLGSVFTLVMHHAFRSASMTGGFAGATVMMAMRYGIARGFYSNEAGTGSSPIMYSTAKTDNIHAQSLIGMFGVFIDTVVSTLTIVIVLITGVGSSGLTSTALTTAAFASVFGGAGGILVLMISFLFGYSTLIAWAFYGEQCFAFVCGSRYKGVYRWAFGVAILFGFLKVELVWSLGDLLNASIILINLTALALLLRLAVNESRVREK